jgi:hypothetical protein
MAMQRIEATVRIENDRRLTLQLPETVSPGEHRIVVTIEEPAPGAERCTRREGDVLVFHGVIEGAFNDVVKQVREERIEQFLPSEQRP